MDTSTGAVFKAVKFSLVEKKTIADPVKSKTEFHFNTLRTGDADLRF